VVWLSSAIADIFSLSRLGKIAGVIHMIVKRGAKAYQYQSSRVNGEVKTVYQRTVSVQELHEHEQQKEETQQHRQREQELQHLNEALANALKLIKIMERGYLLVAGYYERKSEIRKLQEDHYAH
jgi:cell shape-determining protein MreC